MLSDREKRIIEIRGEIEFIEEMMNELFFKEKPLDQLEMELLRSAIENLDKLKEELMKLEKGD